MSSEARAFAEVWRETVGRHPGRTFLVFRAEDGSVTTWTYAEFDVVVSRTAGSLRDLGVGPGACVQLVLGNCPAFVAIWLAAAQLGAWMVPVDPSSSARDISSQVQRVGPVVGLCAASRANVYREGAQDRVATVLELAEDASDLAADAPLQRGHLDAPDALPAPDVRLAVMFTSGTTSEPKGVVLTQANYAHVAAAMSSVVALTSADRWYVTLPLFHANAQYYCFAPAIAVGASVALTASFSASGWVQGARELAVTHASLFAAPIRMILARTPSSTEPLQLAHVWFAQSLGAGHYEQFASLVGVRPRQLYGMTETVAIVCADDNPRATHDVIGHPIPGREVRVVDPLSGEEAVPDAPGELVVAGAPGHDLFAGYLASDGGVRSVFTADDRGTWFPTGDLVARDAQGVLRFVGRVDDVIKVAGENVSLTEVEATLAQAPGVLEVAVVARPDPIRDQVPVAYYVAKDPTQPPSPEELAAWAAQNLPSAARPREWHLIDALPRTSVGKVRRFRIGDDGADATAAGAAGAR